MPHSDIGLRPNYLRSKLAESSSTQEQILPIVENAEAVQRHEFRHGRGRSTIDQKESTGQNTVFISKLGPVQLNPATVSEMQRTAGPLLFDASQGRTTPGHNHNRSEMIMGHEDIRVSQVETMAVGH